MERSIPTENIFAASREVGLGIYNCTEDKNITWSGGIFFDSLSDTVKLRTDSNQGYRLAGRATWLPYYDEPSNGRYLIHTGAGILHTDDQDDLVRFRARPQIHAGPQLIDSGNLAADTYTTGNLEFAAVWGPVTLQSEAFVSSVNLTGTDPVQVNGAYAHLSYFLTGENRIFERFGQHGAQFGRNVPFTNFFAVPGSVGSGAWELKARWSHLDLSSVAKGQYNDVTVGCNWYWTDRTRVMFDWINPHTSRSTPFGSTQSNILAVRFDFNW
jgi:phosphate-selective porin OprO and OprP